MPWQFGVDDKLILGRRLHRQIAGLGAIEDAVDVAPPLAKPARSPKTRSTVSRLNSGIGGIDIGKNLKDRLYPEQASEDSRIMATCREQDKTMPDRVVKAQALPKMKERAERVENTPDRKKP